MDISPQLLNVIGAIIVGVVYATIGWKASKEPFDKGKYLTTLFLQMLTSLGVTLSGIDLGPVYIGQAGLATTITVLVQKAFNWGIGKQPTLSGGQDASTHTAFWRMPKRYVRKLLIKIGRTYCPL